MIRCEDVRAWLSPGRGPSALSDEEARQAAEHLDECEGCDRELGARLGDLFRELPVTGRPSMEAVRRIEREDRRRFGILRATAAAAALLVVAATGWTLLRGPRGGLPGIPDPHAGRPTAEAAAPPRIEQLSQIDRGRIESEGVLTLYLQFCLSCLNRPTPEDRREFLVRALLILREVRGSMKLRYEGRPSPDGDAVTQEGLSRALELLRSSPLPSVPLLPQRITGFKRESAGQWHVNHILGTTPFRLTLPPPPAYLNFAYLRIALGADDRLMDRIEETLWFDVDVDLPRRLAEKDPGIAPAALRAVLPLLTPAQQGLYRKIVGPM